MAGADLFAFARSGLDRFLQAEIGTELNGSRLTVLSVLARNGDNPWATAAKWSRMSRSGAAGCLAAAIARMPLAAGEPDAVDTVAARLVQLLPASGPDRPGGAPRRRRPRIALAWCALAVGFAASFAWATHRNGHAAPAPTVPSAKLAPWAGTR